jgi:hypothetical protein
MQSKIEEYTLKSKILSKLYRNYLIIEIEGVKEVQNEFHKVEIKIPRIKYIIVDN